MEKMENCLAAPASEAIEASVGAALCFKTMALHSFPWPSMIFHGPRWPSMVIHGPPWCFTALDGPLWCSIALNGVPWPSMAPCQQGYQI